jgi:hypothetical protein
MHPCAQSAGKGVDPSRPMHCHGDWREDLGSFLVTPTGQSECEHVRDGRAGPLLSNQHPAPPLLRSPGEPAVLMLEIADDLQERVERSTIRLVSDIPQPEDVGKAVLVWLGAPALIVRARLA